MSGRTRPSLHFPHPCSNGWKRTLSGSYREKSIEIEWMGLPLSIEDGVAGPDRTIDSDSPLSVRGCVVCEVRMLSMRFLFLLLLVPFSLRTNIGFVLLWACSSQACSLLFFVVLWAREQKPVTCPAGFVHHLVPYVKLTASLLHLACGHVR